MTPREEELLQRLAERDAENAALRQEIALLKQKVDLLIKRIFGSKSETLSPDQLELLLGPEKQGKADASSEKEEAKFSQLTVVRESGERKSRPVRQPRIPDHLPAIVEIIDPEEVKTAPEQWRHIGDEISEQLDYKPGHFFKRQLIRRKYVERGVLDPRFAIAPCRLSCKNAVLPLRGSWRKSSSISLPTIYRFTGRRGIIGSNMVWISRDKPWRVGLAWRPTGSSPSIRKSSAPSFPRATSRSMKLPSNT